MEVLNYSTNYKGTFPLAMLRELAEWVAREIQEKSKYLKKCGTASSSKPKETSVP